MSNPETTSPLAKELRAIRERCLRLPVLDSRDPEEILGYGKDGLPESPGGDFSQTDLTLVRT